MRKRSVFFLAVSVCLAVAFTPLMADRTDRTADRTKAIQSATSQDDRTSIHPVVQRVPFQVRGNGDYQVAQRAESLVARAATQSGNDAIATLMQAVAMGSENEKLMTEAYTRLGDLYQGTATKQVQFYGAAMQTTSDPAVRAQLQTRINDLGGDVFAFAIRPNSDASASTRDAGPDDMCPGDAITLPWYELMSITPIGDHNWRMFDVPGPDGLAVQIETISQNPPYWDDTTLAVYADCIDGTPVGQLYYNDDGGEGFMSLIQTDCLAPGTYFIDVFGFFDVTEVLDFYLDVQVTDVCILPTPDAYEPDDTKAEASGIGLPSSIPDHANGWGRAKSEIQDHTIFPPFDVDNMEFGIQPGAEYVRMGTAFTFPTFFNDFTYEPIGYDADSYIELHYGVNQEYGGFCNDLDLGFQPHCWTDDDCDEVANPHPAFPNGACIPMYLFTFGGVQKVFVETPLAANEDAGFGDWGSELIVCLPRADNNTPSLTADGDWILRVMSSPVWAPTGVFLYQAQVKNEVKCRFENEPNNGPNVGNYLELGETVNGFNEVSVFIHGDNGGNAPPFQWFNQDPDWWEFDTAAGETTLAIFETTGYDIYLCDTTLLLYVGPDDNGDFWYTGVFEDDSGPGWLSLLAVTMPSADELLGNTVADASYWLDVTSWWFNANFPYTLFTYGEVYVEPDLEVEPNDTCDVGNAVAVGGSITADIDPGCDFDSFTYSLTEDRYIVLETDTGGSSYLTDSTMAVYLNGDYLACDDDSGTSSSLASRIEGCMPAGDYCARVRGYGSGTVITPYEFTIDDLGPCAATDPPDIPSAGLRCDGGQAEFETCPN